MIKPIWLILCLAISLEVLAIPPPPEALTVYRDGVSNQVVLRWHTPVTVDSFQVQWAAVSDGAYARLTATMDTTFTDAGLQAFRCYQVVAFDAGEASDPSNRCGYFSLAVPAAGALAFGPCFRFWTVRDGVPLYGMPSTKPSDLFGDQPACGTGLTGDLIIRMDNGYYALREETAGCSYRGLLESDSALTLMRAYVYRNRGADARTIVLAGNVIDVNEDGGSDIVIYSSAGSGSNAYVPLSWSASHSLNRNALELIAHGFTGFTTDPRTSDAVYSQTTADMFAYRTTNSAWIGTLTAVQPGQAYYLVNRHSNHPWTYRYTGSGTP